MHIGLIILLVLLLLVVAVKLIPKTKTERMSASEYALNDMILQDMLAANASGTQYIEYKNNGRVPLTAWQFAQLVNLARKGELTSESVSSVMTR
jgi:urocanate hydratase